MTGWESTLAHFRGALLACAAIAFACAGPRARGDASAGEVVDAAGATDGRRAPERGTDPNAALASSLTVSVKGGVTLKLHVTNTAEKAIELVFPSGQTHDFAVVDSAGREVWRWSRDRLFTQTLQTKLLRPRETFAYEGEWRSPPRAGTFIATATLRSRNHPIEQRVEFKLP